MIVRSFGSQMVALACASGHRLHLAIHSPLESCLLHPRHFEPLRSPGSGPRLVPSHVSQPIAQPFENFVDRARSATWWCQEGSRIRTKRPRTQKHAWPFWPEILPSFSDQTGHQPVADSTPGGSDGTGPLHGSTSLSTAFRGGGKTTAPCPVACLSSDVRHRARAAFLIVQTERASDRLIGALEKRRRTDRAYPSGTRCIDPVNPTWAHTA